MGQSMFSFYKGAIKCRQAMHKIFEKDEKYDKNKIKWKRINKGTFSILENFTFTPFSFQKLEEDIQGKRSDVLEIDNMGSQIKYFSQKQDAMIIKNRLLSMHARYAD